MKLTILDSLIKRIAFSFGLASIVLILCYFIGGPDFLGIQWVPLIIVSVYVIVTLFYAIASTFFEEDDTIPENDEILDQ